MSGAIDRTNVLGVGISAINPELARAIVGDWIARRQHNYVCITGVHGVMESQGDEELRTIHNRAGLVTPDGMPMVWLSRLAGRKEVRRVYGPDLMLDLCDVGRTAGWRHYFYGGGEGVAQRLAERLVASYPGLAVAGWHTPPFRALTPEEDSALVREINDAHPDILWIGLSTPKQERWMAAHLGRIEAPVMVGVGAAFDFNAGLKQQAPRWMQRNGLEWLYRLASEPRRLGRRYLVNNPRFLFRVGLQLAGLRRYEL